MDFLNNLSVGDKVIVDVRFGNNKVIKLDGETPKFWKIGSDLFDKKNGRMRGSSGWYPTYIKELTDDKEKEIFRKNAIVKITKYDFSKLDDSQMQSILSIINDVKGGISEHEN